MPRAARTGGLTRPGLVSASIELSAAATASQMKAIDAFRLAMVGICLVRPGERCERRRGEDGWDAEGCGSPLVVI